MTAAKVTSAVMLTLMGSLAISVPASAHSATQIRQEAIEKREAAQAQAIVAGRQDGGLTWWERYRLVREQRRIEKLEQQTLADGRITKAEYYAVKRAQTDASAHISEDRHNEAVRGWWWRTFVR